jgi:hypothetical protein
MYGLVAQLHTFRTSALFGDKWSIHPHAATPGHTTAGTHCMQGWEGLGVGLDGSEENTVSSPLPGYEPDSTFVQPVT